MDVISDVLNRVRFTRRKYARLAPVIPWCLAFPAVPGLSLQLVETGAATLRVDGTSESLLLERGDLILLTRGQAHLIGSDVSRVGEPFDLAALLRLRSPLAAPSSGAGCTVVAGKFEIVGDGHPLLKQLPEVIVVKAQSVGAGTNLIVALRMLTNEALQDREGGNVLIDRLSDVVFVEVLRAAIGHIGQSASWLRGLGDPSLGPILGLLHADSARRWTIAELAKSAGQSRSGFSASFTRVIGVPPMNYVASLRMARARQLLTNPTEPVARIATTVGYDNTASFANAFKRETGMTPVQFRRQSAGQMRVDL
jgi:AraC-like DNA-binding protein